MEVLDTVPGLYQTIPAPSCASALYGPGVSQNCAKKRPKNKQCGQLCASIQPSHHVYTWITRMMSFFIVYSITSLLVDLIKAKFRHKLPPRLGFGQNLRLTSMNPVIFEGLSPNAETGMHPPLKNKIQGMQPGIWNHWPQAGSSSSRADTLRQLNSRNSWQFAHTKKARNRTLVLS